MTITKEVKSKHEQFLSFCDLISGKHGCNKLATIINIPILILLSIALIYQVSLYFLIDIGIEYSNPLKIIDIICSSFISILVLFSITYHYTTNNFLCNKDKRNCCANIFCGYVAGTFIIDCIFLAGSLNSNQDMLIHSIIACAPFFLYVHLMIPAILYCIFALFYYMCWSIYLCSMKLTNNCDCNEFCNEIKQDIDQNVVYYEEKNEEKNE